MTTDTMRYLATTLHNSDKGPLLQVGADYTELFGDDGENREQEVNAVTRNLFAMSRLFNASVIAISQSVYGANPGKTYIAGLNGLRYSRGVTHAADIVVELLNYPEMTNKGINFKAPETGEFASVLDENKAWLLIEKYREGATGAVPFGWEAPYTRFFDPILMRMTADDPKVYEHLDTALKQYYNDSKVELVMEGFS
jgi:replicative DNA helicase